MQRRNLDNILIMADVDGRQEPRCLTDCPAAEVRAWLTRAAAQDGPDAGFAFQRAVLDHLLDRLDAFCGDVGQPREALSPLLVDLITLVHAVLRALGDRLDVSHSAPLEEAEPEPKGDAP